MAKRRKNQKIDKNVFIGLFFCDLRFIVFFFTSLVTFSLYRVHRVVFNNKTDGLPCGDRSSFFFFLSASPFLPVVFLFNEESNDPQGEIGRFNC